MNTKLYKSKTIWTGVIAVLTAAGVYFTGEMDMGTAIQTVDKWTVRNIYENGN